MYDNGGRGVSTTLRAAPLLGIQWTNLINNSSPGGYLYGYMKGGLNYSPDMTQGGFIIKSQDVYRDLNAGKTRVDSVRVPASEDLNGPMTWNTPRAASRTGTGMYTINGKESSFIPKKVSISFTFSVLHTHLMGWQQSEDMDPEFSSYLTGEFPNAVYVVQDKKFVLTTEGEVTTDMTLSAANQALVLEGT